MIGSSNNVFGNVFAYSDSRSVFGIVHQFRNPLSVSSTPQAGWSMSANQRVFLMPENQRVWMLEKRR